MYDMTKIKTRYFDVKLKNGKFLNVESPKLKVLKKITALSKIKDENNLTDEDIEALSESLSLALSKNKQNYKISAEFIEDNFNINEILGLLTNYFEWVGNESKN